MSAPSSQIVFHPHPHHFLELMFLSCYFRRKRLAALRSGCYDFCPVFDHVPVLPGLVVVVLGVPLPAQDVPVHEEGQGQGGLVRDGIRTGEKSLL